MADILCKYGSVEWIATYSRTLNTSGRNGRLSAGRRTTDRIITEMRFERSPRIDCVKNSPGMAMCQTNECISACEDKTSSDQIAEPICLFDMNIYRAMKQ